jgi:hypothetical protein
MLLIAFWSVSVSPVIASSFLVKIKELMISGYALLISLIALPKAIA